MKFPNVEILAPNHARIYTDEGVACQSYSSVIAFRDHSGHVTLDADAWDYSATTGEHHNAFLHENISETRKKIAYGTYALANLNR